MFQWTSLLCLWIWLTCCTGLDLVPCISGSLDAQELTSASLTCEDTSNHIWWKIYRGSAKVSTVATCNSSVCVSQANATDVQATRPSKDTAVLHLDLKTHRNHNVKLQCFSRNHLTCSVRSVYYPEPRNCQFDVKPGAMRVSGSCDIPKIYASDDNYLCQWTRISTNGSTTLNGTFSLISFEEKSTNLTYKTGTCSFTSFLFLVQGIFNFSISTSPSSGDMHIASVTVDQYSNVTASGPDTVNITVSKGKAIADLKTVPCSNNRIIDVEEGELISLTCQSTSPTVTWSILVSYRINVAVCNRTHCTMQRGYRANVHSGNMLAVRPNSTFTELYVDTGAYRHSLTTFYCYKYYRYYGCKIHSTYSSWPTNCHFSFDKEDATVSGSCDIPKMYSSSNQYTCNWIEQFQEQTERTISGNFTTSTFIENGLKYKRGTCSFMTPLFEMTGTFTYRIDVKPGYQEYIASIDVAVTGETSSLTISGRGHLDTRITRNVTEVQLFRCYGSTYNVKFGARVGLICPNTGRTVQWNLRYGWNTVWVASCNTTQCTMQGGTRYQDMLATRPNVTTSVLYASLSPYQDRAVRFYCDSTYKSCAFRTVYSSPPTNCSLVIDVGNMTASGECYYEKMFSSEGSYSCNFIIQDGSQAVLVKKGYLRRTAFYDQPTGKTFFTGTCSFSVSFFIIQGSFNISVDATPGSRTHIADVHIDENSNVSVSAADDVSASVIGTVPEMQFLPCTSGKVYDVQPHSQLVLECDASSYYRTRYYSIAWQYHSLTYSSRYSYIALVSCYPGRTCTNNRNTDWFMAVRPNITVSIGYVNMAKYTSNILNVKCSVSYYWSQTCKLRSIYSAPPSNCQIDINAINKTVSGSCDIAKIHAGDDSYSCKWIQSFENQAEIEIHGNLDRRWLYSSGRKTVYNGTCSFTFPLYAIPNSSLSYSVDFDPGDRVYVATVHFDEYLNITTEGAEDVDITVTPGELEAPMVVTCGKSQEVVDIPEDGSVALVCANTMQSFKWQYKYKNSYYYQQVATCNTTSCKMNGRPRTMMATRSSPSASILYYQANSWRLQGLYFDCSSTYGMRVNTKYCYLRPVYPASLVNCSLAVNADDMTVSGSCDIDRVFSSDYIVKCTWVEQFKNQTIKYINGSLGLTHFYEPSTYRTYQNGSCSFSAPLLMVTGVFHYTIHVKPGAPMHIATLHLDGPKNMTLVGAEGVEATIHGAPTEMNMFQCQDGKTVDIPEYSQAGLVCKDDADPPASHMRWVVYPGADQGGVGSNASCGVSSCQVWASEEHMLAVRPNASMSVLYLSLLDKRAHHQRVECWTSSSKFCIIRSAYSSPPTNCRFDFNTTTYRVKGSCDVRKMYTSDGQYTCDWIQQVKRQTTTIPGTKFPLRPFRDPINRLSYRSGTCTVSFPLLMATAGQFTFSIKVSPGTTTYIATLKLGTPNHDHVRLTVGAHVNGTVDSKPSEIPTPSTTPQMTTEEKVNTSQPHPSTSPTSPEAESKTLTYVMGGVGGGLGLILIIVVIVVGVLVLRKLKSNKKPSSVDGGIDNEGYFYTSRLKSGSIMDITGDMSISASIDSSSCL